MGSGVKTIGDFAFNSKSIKTLHVYAATPPTITYNTFPDTYKDEKWVYDIALYVPDESLTAYQTAEVWKNFFNIQGFDTTDIRPVTSDESGAKPVYYDLAGKRLKTPRKGVNIVTVGGKSKKVFVR